MNGDPYYVLAEAEITVAPDNGGALLGIKVGWHTHQARLPSDQALMLASLLRQPDADGHAGPVEAWHDLDCDCVRISLFSIEMEMTEMQAAELARELEQAVQGADE